VTCVRIPAQSPNCNACVELFVKTARDECLRHFAILVEWRLRYVLKNFMAHYHRKRFHRALDGQLIQKSADEAGRSGKVVCRTWPGGMLNFYHREVPRSRHEDRGGTERNTTIRNAIRIRVLVRAVDTNAIVTSPPRRSGFPIRKIEQSRLPDSLAAVVLGKHRCGAGFAF